MELVGTSTMLLRVIEYGMQQERFTLSQLQAALELDDVQFKYISSRLVTHAGLQSDNPNHILCFVNRPATNQGGNPAEDEFSLLPTALFNYIDYVEIKEARRFADSANKQSMLALKLTLYTIIISVLMGLSGMFLQLCQLYLDNFANSH